MKPIDVDAVRAALARSESIDRAPRAPGRHAAVASILRDSPRGAEVLLIRRAEHPEDPWSGHMAFPGGRHDAEDEDLLITAQRETLEEVGLDLDAHGSLVGRLEDTPAIARGKRLGLTIAPFVFELHTSVPLQPNHEVEETIWVPLTPLTTSQYDSTKHYRYEGQDLQLPAWDVEGRIVWGLTHRMLSALLEQLERA